MPKKNVAVSTRTAPALKADGSIAHAGKRTRLTPIVTNEIAQAIRDGAPVRDAICAIAHVAADTAQEWLQIGRGEHPRYPHPHARYARLVEAVDEAESHLASRLAASLARPDEHYKGRLAILGALRPEYRERQQYVPDSSPLHGLAEVLREVRLASVGNPLQLEVVEGEVLRLPEPELEVERARAREE